jgi:hypothetical protein
MPSRKPRVVTHPNQPLAAANTRLQMLEKAGYPFERVATLLAKSLVRLEELLDKEDIDAFALVAAIKMVTRDIAAVAPMKASATERPPQVPVTIVMPTWVTRRDPEPVKATVIEALPSAPQPADPADV